MNDPTQSEAPLSMKIIAVNQSAKAVAGATDSRPLT